MPNASDQSPFGGGGGTPAYFNAREKFRDLSSASYDSVGVLTDIGKTVALYSSVEGRTYKLPAANTAGLTVGKGTGFRILPRSKPIRILNQGTAGTDPILEAFGQPGADFTLFANSVASTVGDWQGRGYGMLNIPVPFTLPAALDAGFDAGATIVNAAVNLGSHVGQNLHWARVTSTLYVFAYSDNACTSIKVVAATYNHSTDAWTWGAAVTAFTSANTWYFPRIIGFANGSYCCLAFQDTTNTVGARGGTISGTTITQGTAITSGAWGVNGTVSAAMKCSSLVADSATTFFWSTCYDGTHLGIEQFTMTGANVAATAGSTFASSSINASLFDLGGYSPAANTIELMIPSDNTAVALSRYAVSATAVSNTWNRLAKLAGTPSTQKLAYGNSSRQYWMAGMTSSMARVVMNAGFTDVAEYFGSNTPWGENDGQWPAMKNMAFFSDDELVLRDAQSQMISFALVNTSELRSKKIAPVTGSNQSVVPGGAFRPMGPGFSAPFSLFFGMDINPTNRRMSVVYSNTGQSFVSGRGVYAQMYDLPRNYDQQALV